MAAVVVFRVTFEAAPVTPPVMLEPDSTMPLLVPEPVIVTPVDRAAVDEPTTATPVVAVGALTVTLL
jgi:hypothetical protein